MAKTLRDTSTHVAIMQRKIAFQSITYNRNFAYDAVRRATGDAIPPTLVAHPPKSKPSANAAITTKAMSPSVMQQVRLGRTALLRTATWRLASTPRCNNCNRMAAERSRAYSAVAALPPTHACRRTATCLARANQNLAAAPLATSWMRAAAARRLAMICLPAVPRCIVCDMMEAERSRLYSAAAALLRAHACRRTATRLARISRALAVTPLATDGVKTAAVRRLAMIRLTATPRTIA